uniref:Uncharacterized protein n=1 Tax=Oryza brachyantha TaxID=4533 RepID=J3L8B2_ORYBR
MARLPVKSLLRFRSVCRAWRATISDDPSFLRAHLQHQRPSFLIARQMATSVGFFRLQEGQNLKGTATLLHAAAGDVLPVNNPHPLAHCDGLVLVPTDDKQVRVFNPATAQIAVLPWSPGADRPSSTMWPRRLGSHQSFGLGRDPVSGAYKVARFFYREVYAVATGANVLTTGMEVFTLQGDNREWRGTAAQPTHPVLTQRTATFFEVEGSLLWVTCSAGSFLRFNLEDETFTLTPGPPPMEMDNKYEECSLVEVRGELCVARPSGPRHNCKVEMWWMSRGGGGGEGEWEWQLRYSVRVGCLTRPISAAASDHGDGVLFVDVLGYMSYYDGLLGVGTTCPRLRDVACVHRLRWQRKPTDNTAAIASLVDDDDTYPGHFYLNTVPYVQSLVQIP